METHYLQLLQKILKEGTHKDAARENMPGTLSVFGHQIRHDLSKGFPLLTTKKINFKHIVTELLWFLKGDTNIKYLVDNGCNIWNEDAYNFYLKQNKIHKDPHAFTFEDFITYIKSENCAKILKNPNDYYRNGYKLGNCGKQYGWLWRHWEDKVDYMHGKFVDEAEIVYKEIDQIKDLIEGLRSNPMGRRHILTAWNPATLNDMALNACHAFVQFNCRPLSITERHELYLTKDDYKGIIFQLQKDKGLEKEMHEIMDEYHIPKYKLDCQMYQRSCDLVLGGPFNITSYSLLTHIFAKICNMIPGDFIHTFGDVHIYDDHLDAVKEQLSRTPTELPTLLMKDEFHYLVDNETDISKLIDALTIDMFIVDNYNPQSSIKAKLSTGLK